VEGRALLQNEKMINIEAR